MGYTSLLLQNNRACTPLVTLAIEGNVLGWTIRGSFDSCAVASMSSIAQNLFHNSHLHSLQMLANPRTVPVDPFSLCNHASSYHNTYPTT